MSDHETKSEPVGWAVFREGKREYVTSSRKAAESWLEYAPGREIVPLYALGDWVKDVLLLLELVRDEKESAPCLTKVRLPSNEEESIWMEEAAARLIATAPKEATGERP